MKSVNYGRLYGIGIGPGDPKLLTLKAKEILDRVNLVFCPKGDEGGTSWARSIVEVTTATPKKFVELTFPMTRDKKVLKDYWQKAAERIAQELAEGKEGAFITLGDPFVYSTYIYLLKTLRHAFPRIEVETVPGITAFNAAAARSQVPLVQGEERLAVLPVTRTLKGLREAFETFDTVILMKVGSKLDRVMNLLKDMDLLKSSILVSRLGHPEEKIISDLSSWKGDKKAGYLSVIIVKVPRRKH